MAKDKELQDHERAHSGQPGAKVKHGASATQTNYPRRATPDGVNRGKVDSGGTYRDYDAEDKSVRKSIPMRNMRDFDKL